MTDDTATIREESALLADWAEEPLGMSSVDVDEVRARLIAALDRVEARLAAPCHCDKCLDCLAADGYEAAIERAEQAERERDEAVDLHVDAVTLAGEHLDSAEAANARVAALTETLRRMLDELGVPNESYPAPVANAVDIGRAALAGPQTKEQT